MQLTELTQEEKQLVINHRRKQAGLLNNKLSTTDYVRIALEFMLFIEGGNEATYSTFCDDFGYRATDGEDRPNTWRIVVNIIKLARREASK